MWSWNCRCHLLSRATSSSLRTLITSKKCLSSLCCQPTSLFSCSHPPHSNLTERLPGSRQDFSSPNTPTSFRWDSTGPWDPEPLTVRFAGPLFLSALRTNCKWHYYYYLLLLLLVQLTCDGKARPQASPIPRCPESAPNPQEQCFHFAIFSQVSLLVIVCPY